MQDEEEGYVWVLRMKKKDMQEVEEGYVRILRKKKKKNMYGNVERRRRIRLAIQVEKEGYEWVCRKKKDMFG